MSNDLNQMFNFANDNKLDNISINDANIDIISLKHLLQGVEVSSQLSDKEYKILSNKYKIESDCYTTILCVKLLTVVEEEKRKENKSRMDTMASLMSI